MKVLSEGWPKADFEARILPTINQMTEDRGWIINSYAQLEFLAADLIVKCRKFEAYVAFSRQPLPFGIDNRISRIRELCKLDPLAAHAESVVPIFEYLLNLEETRHLLIHGFCSIHVTQDGKQIGMHFRRYVPPEKGAGGQERRSEVMVLPGDMTLERDRWARFAQTAVEILRGVYERLGIDSHDVTDGNPPRLGRLPSPT